MMSVTHQEPVPEGMVYAAAPGGVSGKPSHLVFPSFSGRDGVLNRREAVSGGEGHVRLR
jgi:hypothetical protein